MRNWRWRRACAMWPERDGLCGASRDAEIEQLKLPIAKLRRVQFGRKSEKVERQIEQLQLRLDELEASRAEQTASSAAPSAAVRRSDASKPVRRAPPKQPPREARPILPKQTTCPDCGGQLKPFGEDASETLAGTVLTPLSSGMESGIMFAATRILPLGSRASMRA